MFSRKKNNKVSTSNWQNSFDDLSMGQFFDKNLKSFIYMCVCEKYPYCFFRKIIKRIKTTYRSMSQYI